MPTPGRYDGRPMRRLRVRVKREEPTCWLCGATIDPELKAPDPGSFSVDHVQPVALGGSELDRANARAAHRLCNMRRGTGRRRPPGRQSRDW